MVFEESSIGVGQILAQYPQSEEVFKLLNIDLDAKESLPDIAEARGWPADILNVALTAARKSAKDGSTSDSLQAHLRESIVLYVQGYYHQPLEGMLMCIESLVADAVASYPPDANERICQIRDAAARLAKQLRIHVSIEDELLFPNLCNGGRGGESDVSAGEKVLHEMDGEHEILDTCFHDIAELTDNYTPSPGDNIETTVLYKELKAFDLRFAQHEKVEHDFLWPSTAGAAETAEMEQESTTPPLADLADHLCPRDHKPCKKGHPSTCGEFWTCLQSAIDVRWDSGLEDTEPPT